ncbi:MAG: alpha-hydroxy-acid oxidizing protein [Acidobacteria bacterium]|nr:alpha-hydroxy-acid oxidizing protein [Acidobacteriota bacterium]
MNSGCDRRQAFRLLAGFIAGSPLFAQEAGEDVNTPVNVHEFEAIAQRKLNKLAFDFIAGGVEDELTLRANREAYKHWFLAPRFMVDVTEVDTSSELLGIRLGAPIIIAPTGGKNLVLPEADTVVARAAIASKTLLCSGAGAQKLIEDGQPLDWWTNTTGHPAKSAAAGFARRAADAGAKAIVVTVDNPYQSNRDRNNRNRFDYGYMQTGVPKPGEKPAPRNPARAAPWQPHTPNLTWNYIDWLRSGADLPVILKGILSPEDARLAVERGASAVVVSNHGGRQLDGAIATLDALPEVVGAAAGKIPVLMDGGIRRGSDVLKALALGAKAVMVGRPPLWGLGAFGQAGVERVLWMLAAELKLSMALAGQPNLRSIDRKLVRRA